MKHCAPATRPSERQLLFKALKTVLAAHAAAEARFFYVPLIAHDMTQMPSCHGIAEHHEMDELVEEVKKKPPPARLSGYGVLRRLVTVTQWRGGTSIRPQDGNSSLGLFLA